ncbi:MAG: MFS transporter [Planctomycetota bacterium]
MSRGSSHSPEVRNAMRAAILGQCTGLIPLQVLYAGGMAVVMVLSLGGTHVEAMVAQSTVHVGYLASVWASLKPMPHDRVLYMMRCSQIGAVGLVLAAAVAYWAPAAWLIPGLLLSLFFYRWAAGAASAFWYPVLQDFVNKGERGRFFATMRATWSVVTMLAGLGLGSLLATMAPAGSDLPVQRQAYAIILFLMGLSFVARNLFFRHLPHTERPDMENPLAGGWKALARGLRGEGEFWGFLAYLGPQTFFLALFAPLVVTALRDVAGYSDGETVQAGMIGTLGSIAAYVACMGLADRVGPKRMFLACQTACSLASLLMAACLGGHLPLDMGVLVTALNVVLCAAGAALGVATTTYLLHVVQGPGRNICFSLYFALSSFVSGTAVVAMGFVMDYGPRFLDCSRDGLVTGLFALAGVGLLVNLPSVKRLREGDWPAEHPPRSPG